MTRRAGLMLAVAALWVGLSAGACQRGGDDPARRLVGAWRISEQSTGGGRNWVVNLNAGGAYTGTVEHWSTALGATNATQPVGGRWTARAVGERVELQLTGDGASAASSAQEPIPTFNLAWDGDDRLTSDQFVLQRQS